MAKRQDPPAKAPSPSAATAEFMRRLDLDSGPSHLPLYRQLAHALHSAIQSGRLAAGAGIPPERDLATGLGLSRITVRRAIGDLVRQGLLVARQGSGTVVAARVEQALSDLGSFSDDIRRRGLQPGSRWLSRALADPSPDEIIALNLALTDRVIRIARVRTADGAPIAIERATVRAELLGGDPAFGESLYAALRRRGVTPARALQRLRAEVVRGADARLLELADGEAALATERRSFAADGRPIEITHSLYRGDRYDYLVELRQGATGGGG